VQSAPYLPDAPDAVRALRAISAKPRAAASRCVAARRARCQCGNQAFSIAVTFWTAQTTHSATLTGAMLMANVLPVILLAPFTGAFADRHRSRLRIIAAADLTSGALASLAIALVVLSQLRSRWMAIAVAAGTGVLAAVINVLTTSIVQRRTEPSFRGRVMGLQSTLTRALVPVGMVGGGAIADLTGRNVPLVYAACGAFALAAAAQLVLRRSTRAFLAAE